MRRVVLIFIAAILFILASPPRTADAWLRVRYEDGVIVERSEIVAVAHIKKGSIEYVPHANEKGRGRSWEHHATLVIAELLKGKLEEKEIPITIHYGLTPVVGGLWKQDVGSVNLRRKREDYPPDIIEIIDTGNSGWSGVPLVKDAGKDNLWFLMRRSGQYGHELGKGKFGIADPEDLQPLALKDYLLTYNAKNPGKAVKEYVAKHPEVADKTKGYFDHLEIEKIKKIENLDERAARLVPYFINRQRWNGKSEAEDALAELGDAAGRALLVIFDEPYYKKSRRDIMRLWKRTKYRGCVDRLISLLEENADYWARELGDTSFETREYAGLTSDRQQRFTDVSMAAYVLGYIPDIRARKVLERTREIWVKIDFEDDRIVEHCDRALKSLAKAEKK